MINNYIVSKENNKIAKTFFKSNVPQKLLLEMYRTYCNQTRKHD